MKLDGEKLLAKLRFIEAGINDEIKSEKDNGARSWVVDEKRAELIGMYHAISAIQLGDYTIEDKG